MFCKRRFLYPPLPVKVSGHAGVFFSAANCELHHFVDTAKESVLRLPVNVLVLFFGRYVRDNKHFRETRLPIEIAAREEEGVSVQVVKHISALKAAPEFFKDYHILPVISIKGVFVVRYPVLMFVSPFRL